MTHVPKSPVIRDLCRGFGGPIELIVAIDSSGTLAPVREYRFFLETSLWRFPSRWLTDLRRGGRG